MQEKHPPASVALSDLPRPNVQQSVSPGGPDGLCPQHIRDLIMCREAGTDLLGALTAFVNLVPVSYTHLTLPTIYSV